MKQATKLIAKRMGHGKSADLNGLERGIHVGDAKRTERSKKISRMEHARRARNTRTTFTINSEAETEFSEFYSKKF